MRQRSKLKGHKSNMCECVRAFKVTGYGLDAGFDSRQGRGFISLSLSASQLCVSCSYLSSSYQRRFYLETEGRFYLDFLYFPISLFIFIGLLFL